MSDNPSAFIEALQKIAAAAEHASFGASALPADEDGMVWCAREFVDIMNVAKTAMLAARTGGA